MKPSRKQHYYVVAKTAEQQARALLRSAHRLYRAHERGIAVGIAVLSIEEAVKAFYYHQAAKGEIQFVTKNPNNITTFRQKDLTIHKVKHNIIISTLLFSWKYYPLMESIENAKKVHSPSEARELMLRTTLTQIAWDFTIADQNNKSNRTFLQMIQLANRLDHLKLRGFYTDSINGVVMDPKSINRKEAKLLMKFADEMVEAFGLLGSVTSSTNDKQIIRGFARIISKRINEQKPPINGQTHRK